MTVDVSAEGLKKELKVIGDRMTADWIKLAGADGQAVIDAYSRK
jgi:methanogenic corrinoid protein MtbC1